MLVSRPMHGVLRPLLALFGLLIVVPTPRALSEPAQRHEARSRAQSQSTTQPRVSAKHRAAAGRAQRLGLGTRRAASRLLSGDPEPRWVRAAGRGAHFPGTLRFPVVKGWFSRGFGSGEDGYHQAVDIGGEVGWNVRAAAPGLVGYAGDELGGFGNVVMLVHAGGFVTLYAHNEQNLVVAGELVERGSVLAELGSTGRAQGPHVHFELLYDGENCDPAPLFRPGAKRRTGKLITPHRATWRPPKKRPDSVVCLPRKHHPNHRKHPAPNEEDLGGDEEADHTANAG